MANLKECRTKLNPVFLRRLEQQFDIHTVDAILNGFSAEKIPVIRVNTLKNDTLTVMRYFKEINVLFERIPFLPDSLVVRNKDEKFFEKMEIYGGGGIYFQGISSQLPALFLGPQADEKVLDVAAAPGSKTTQMAIMMKNRGEIFANELNQIRFERLKYNLDKQGVKIATSNLGDGTILGEKFPCSFDKVLLDAPCSAEGRICINDPRSYRFWSEKNIRQNVKIQKKLIISGIKALKAGGVLVYSTCTLAPEENEGVADYALKTFGQDLKLEKINFDFKYRLPILTSFNGYSFDSTVKYAIKAMPSQISEGFFVAKFKKTA